MSLVFITGAASGLGEALASQLASEQSAVISIVRPGRVGPPGTQTLEWDLEHPDSMPVDRIGDLVTSGDGPVVAVLNAATLGRLGVVGGGTESSLASAMSVNVLSHARLAALLVDLSRSSGRPLHVVLVSSGAARRPIPEWSVYCASKAAIEMYVRCLETDHPQVRVDVIDPGVIDTSMQASIFEHSGQDVPVGLPDAASVARRVLTEAGL